MVQDQIMSALTESETMIGTISPSGYNNLKIKTIPKCFVCPYKRQIRCNATSKGTLERGTFTTQVKRFYIVIEAG